MRDLEPPRGPAPSEISSSDYPRTPPPPQPRPRFSHRAIRALRGCPTTCPFTDGVACEPGSAVVHVPRTDVRDGLLPEGITRVCAGCEPKLAAAREALQTELEAERRARAEAKQAAKIAKRQAREDADHALQELRTTVSQVAERVVTLRELKATAEARRQGRAQERRQALLHLRACEGEVRRAERALEEAKRAISDLPPVESGQALSDERARLLALLSPVAERTANVVAKTSKSYQRKHIDKALWAEVFELIDWLEDASA